METLKVTLKQHTPLIHFQSGQYGATLRASEVKPKLDRFILAKLGNGDYEIGKIIAKDNGWLIGNGVHRALNYKMKIENGERLIDVSLNVKKKNNKYTTADFPLLLSNMGGQESADDLVNLVMYKNVTWTIITDNLLLHERLKEQIPYFVMNCNFGQRANKGFGSFSVTKIQNTPIDSTGTDPYYIAEDTSCLDFTLDCGIDTLNGQMIIFKVIEIYWSKLKQFFKRNRITHINDLKSYINGMKLLKDADSVQRFPAPIMFKPISSIDKKGNQNISLYIMFDSDFMQRLKSEYNQETLLAGTYKFSAKDINDLYQLDDFDESIYNKHFQNWRVRISKEEYINIYFYKQ